MLKFEKNIDDRKELVKRLEELTGTKAVYTFMPRAAYEVEAYTVERDGSLTVEEAAADLDILNTLLYEGLILGELPAEETETEDAAEEAPAVTEAEPTEEPAAETEEEPTEEEHAEAEPTVEAEQQEQGSEEPLLDIGKEETDCLNISFPADKHTGNSLRNLIRMLYSRAELINKSTGAHFHVEKGLIDALADDRCTYSTVSLRMAVMAYENEHGASMSGLHITDEEVTIGGFPLKGDADHAKACTDLAALMNRAAIRQKRINTKEVEADNERYAFRIWLIRLGMSGAEYKQTRKVLMENLSGNTAFRTEEDAEKFKAKEKEKRAKLRAAKAAAEEEAETQEENQEEEAETNE